MSEEEIINKWFEKNMCVSFKKFTENWEEQQELTNYLQQENSQLKELIETLKNTNALLIKQKYQLEKDLDNESNKIEKAIEYIKTHCSGIFVESGDIVYVTPSANILEILKGDKE